MSGDTVMVHKLDHTGKEVWAYPGTVVSRSDGLIILEAAFDRDSIRVGCLVLNPGDLFREYFYDDRWYNVFRISEPESGMLKGFYCNFTRPAVFSPGNIHAEDLALDLLVYPGGKWELLDTEEYEELDLNPSDRIQVSQALEDLKRRIARQEPPFTVAPGPHAPDAGA